MARICSVIPAYNEQLHLGVIIKGVKKHGLDVIVVDDGSTDQTATIAAQEADFFIRHPENKGKGCALRSGFAFAFEKGYQAIITIDGDGQHNPADIPLFVKRAESSHAGIVIGNRMHCPKGMPPVRVLCNMVGTKMISVVCKQHIPDALNGYRIIKREVLESVTLETEGFDIDPEILIKASQVGFTVDSVNIECVYGKEVSHIRPLFDGYDFFRIVIKSALNRAPSTHLQKSTK